MIVSKVSLEMVKSVKVIKWMLELGTVLKELHVTNAPK
jgi:hypothetical protein